MRAKYRPTTVDEVVKYQSDFATEYLPGIWARVREAAPRSDEQSEAIGLYYLAHAAENGQTYFVGRDVGFVLEAASRQSSPNALFNRADMPSDSGFLILEEDICTYPCAQSHFCEVATHGITGFGWWSDNPKSLAIVPFTIEKTGECECLRCTIGLMGYDDIGSGVAWDPTERALGFNHDPLNDRPHVAEFLPIVREGNLWLHAFTAFTRQKLLTLTDERPSFPTHLRLSQRSWRRANESIQVVHLRKREGATHAGPKDREYSCQWLVSGHWRQQPYPSEGVVRPKWILPYVKGPEGKPLKAPTKTVYAVVR